MTMPVEIAGRIISPFAGVVNRVRHGFPSRYFQGAGRIGDDLMCTTVFRGSRKCSKRSIAIVIRNPGRFKKNPDVGKIIRQTDARLNRLGRLHYKVGDVQFAAPIAPQETKNFE